MDMATERLDDMLLVRVAGPRLDAAIAIQFKEAMRGLAADGPRCVVLDLGRVEFLDSSGLGAVVAVMKALGPGRQLELAALTPAVARVFRLTRMDTIFTIHPEVPRGPATAQTPPPPASAPGPEAPLTVAGDAAHGG